ncbi:hypothetical protein F3Y22_tig00002799pilonHSYRG00116 [Hibiscus syriacus]|uniref:RING-type E3 ubiquitin transferase n=1 Tax=Hibiscus syriacus TaxID=106335 RepID=A0A6A3CWF3_HIBSY|nr:hypothetical protein F3Y22_tig00002799pilonHSYRG00116 [Hibiscus syriacus]
MDLVRKTKFLSTGSSVLVSHSRSSDPSFPIIAIAVVGILATSFLLLSYYIFVIKWLDESVIRRNPIVRFHKDSKCRSFCECAVCLNKLEQDEKLRMIPDCSHIFHIDCIDVWLQNNSNCPLCRTSVSSQRQFQANPIVAPSSTPHDPNPYTETIINGNEDFVVIEIGSNNNRSRSTHQTFLGAQERLNMA